MLKEILNPNLYHGTRKKRNFFEGWYFKIISKDKKSVYAFIPGIIKGKTNSEGHSFIQVMDGDNHLSYYFKYSKDSFQAFNKPFKVKIAGNSFSFDEIIINLSNQNIKINGTLKINTFTKWPDSIINPGSMGFYNYLLFMECYSQVCCLDGKVNGKLIINDKEIDFTDGKIYIEKNWGMKFPDSYIWLQANSFNNETVSLSVSIGRIPFWIFHFNGFLTAIKVEDKIYKFTTINRSQINIDYFKEKLSIKFAKKNLLLKIETKIKEEDYLVIKGPINGTMDRDVKESIRSEIKVTLYDVKKECVLFEGVSPKCGVEVMGNIQTLSKKKGL